MRPSTILSFAIIAPLAGAYALRSVTGDLMSAAFLALTLMVTVMAWLAGPTREGRSSRRS